MQTDVPKILFVDDDERNLLAAQAALTDESFELVLVRSGTDALRTLLDQDFSVIVLDVTMPELDGLETARHIRARDKHRDTPIIFVTAHAHDAAKVQEACELGAIDFLAKPFATELFKAKLRALARQQEKMLADLAEGLRSPLSSMMLDLHVLKQYQGSLQDIRPVLASLERAVQRMNSVLKETLELPEKRQGPARLLVIDDHDDIRETTATLLRFEGFLVETASSGPMGVERARGQRFDLVLLDLGMPDVDGYQTADRLHRQLGVDTPPIVAVTGFGSAADRRKTKAHGFSEHLVKPVDPDELTRVIRRLTGSS